MRRGRESEEEGGGGSDVSVCGLVVGDGHWWGDGVECCYAGEVEDVAGEGDGCMRKLDSRDVSDFYRCNDRSLVLFF